MNEGLESKDFITWSKEQQLSFIRQKLGYLFKGLKLSFDSLSVQKRGLETISIHYIYKTTNYEILEVTYHCSNNMMFFSMRDINVLKSTIFYKRYKKVRETLFEVIRDYKLQECFLEAMRGVLDKHQSEEFLMAKIMGNNWSIKLNVKENKIMYVKHLFFHRNTLDLVITMEKTKYVSLKYTKSHDVINSLGQQQRLAEEIKIEHSNPRKVFEHCFYDLYLKETHNMKNKSERSFKLIEMILY